MSAYEKYMSVPSLFKGIKDRFSAKVSNSGMSADNGRKPMMSSQQQLANQKARAKERDERSVPLLLAHMCYAHGKI